VYRNGQQLLEMINDVLDLSKIEAGEMRLMPEPVEIAPLVMNALSSVAPQARARICISPSKSRPICHLLLLTVGGSAR